MICRPKPITRASKPPPLPGFRTATLDGLLAALEQAGIVDPLIVDLSLGEWRGHELARCCFAQMDAAWPLPEPPPSQTTPAPAPAAVIGDWIDSEGRGDATIRSALLLAEAFFDALGPQPLSLMVLLPRFGIQCQPENAIFLRYLAQGKLPEDRVVLVGDESTVADECAGAPVKWSDAPAAPPRPRKPGLAPLVPGAIDLETKSALDAEGYPFGRGWTLIPPEWRCSLAATPPLEYDRLAAASVDPWLRAFAQFHGSNYFVDPWFLCSEAICRLAEGGQGIAIQLLERAATCAQSLTDRATLKSLAQGFRIALMRYDELIAAPDPSPALSSSLRGALSMTKGWGLVMTGEAQRAEPYMQAARDLLKPDLGETRQFLYLLNISALNRANLGDLDAALSMEKEIERASATFEDRDYRLDYVNSINIARLYRRRNEFDLAAAYYARAFATTAGARTESDLVYTNVCMARLDAARKRPLDSFRAWLRASLHWLSSDVPEAINWRVLSAILGRKAHPAATSFEDVADSLHKLLRAAAEAAGVPVPHEVSSVFDGPAFLRADRFLDRNSAQAFGAPGFSVLATGEPHPASLSGQRYVALATFIAALLASLAHVPALATCPTILVDDGLGREMATSREELIATCMRLSVRSAYFDGSAWELPVERDAALLFDRVMIRQGPAVARVDLLDNGGCVYFKRYLPPRNLSAGEAAFLAACEDNVHYRIGCSSAETLGLVRTLEAARVVEISLESR